MSIYRSIARFSIAPCYCLPLPPDPRRFFLRFSYRSLSLSLIPQSPRWAFASANKALSTLPEMIQLDDCALINFEFLTAPTTTSKYLLTSHKVRCPPCCCMKGLCLKCLCPSDGTGFVLNFFLCLSVCTSVYLCFCLYLRAYTPYHANALYVPPSISAFPPSARPVGCATNRGSSSK